MKTEPATAMLPRRLLVAALVALGLSGCAGAPSQQVGAYVDAFAQVSKAAQPILDQYARDVHGIPADPAERPPPPRYPRTMPADAAGGSTVPDDPDIAARRALLAQVDQYNAVLLAIANGEPFTQTRGLALRLGDLLEKGAAAGAAALGVPAGVLQPIVTAIRNATTRADLVLALRKARVSAEAYRLVTAAADAREARERLADESVVACAATEEASCVALVSVTLAVMQRDVETFFDARHAAVLGQRQKVIGQEAGRVRRQLVAMVASHAPPTESADVETLVLAREEVNRILQGILEDHFEKVELASGAGGAKFTSETRAAVGTALIALRAIDAKDRALGAALHAYARGLAQYKALLATADEYFLAIEAELARTPDLLGVEGPGIVPPLAEKLIDGSVDVQGAIAALLAAR